MYGGPLFTDAFAARRAPSPWELVEKYKSIVFAMVARKRDAVAKTPLRLFVDGSRRVLGGKPRSCCDPIKVSRSTAISHARAGKVSPQAVDEVYEVRNHPFLDTLDKPDPYNYFSRKKLLGLMTAYQDVVGSGILVPEGGQWGDWRNPAKKGPPTYLWTIYPQHVTPRREAGSPLIDRWQYFNASIPFDASIWFRHSISLRDAYGSTYSPLYAGDVYADQEDRFMAIFDQVLGLGPRPSVVASAKDPNAPPGESERKRLQQDFSRTQAAGNAGGLWVNTGAWEFTPMTYSPADLAGKEVSEYDRNNLACIFGLPPTYFTTETNLANLEAADAYFARFGVEPMCASIADTLTQIVQSWDRRLYFQFDPVLAEDELKKAQVDKIYVDMGAITVNEVMEEKKYPPKPWGNEPILNTNMLPLSLIIEKHQQGIEQGNAALESQKRRDDFELQNPDNEEPVEAGDADVDEGEAELTERSLDSAAQDSEIQAVTRRARWLLDEVRRVAS